MAQLHAAKQLPTANTDETVLIADVARAYGLSRQYFTKAFKAATGVTPHRRLPRYRVETATQLLGTTSLPIAEIAIECGFADRSHFYPRIHAAGREQPGKLAQARHAAPRQGALVSHTVRVFPVGAGDRQNKIAARLCKMPSSLPGNVVSRRCRDFRRPVMQADLMTWPPLLASTSTPIFNRAQPPSARA